MKSSSNYSEPSKSRRYRKPSEEEMVKGDRITLALIFMAATALAIISAI
ncbi:hypothetical protein [Pedobacter sp. Leaf132]|nr:hypothetical protein [Pedobacter sp. Leaf132]